MAVSPYQAAVLSDAPGAYWHLGEAAGIFPDLTGHGNNMNATGTSPIRAQPGLVPGNSDGCIQANAGASGAGMGGTSPTTDLGDIWTVEAWIKRTETSTAVQTIMSKPNGGYNVRINNNRIELLCAGTAVLATSTVTVADTNVHHIVGTKSGASGHIYLDGVEVTGTYTNTTTANTAYWFAIGNDNGAAAVVNMFIDEVAIYPTALSLARVQAHYNTGLTPWSSGVPGARMMTGVG